MAEEQRIEDLSSELYDDLFDEQSSGNDLIPAELEDPDLNEEEEDDVFSAELIQNPSLFEEEGEETQDDDLNNDSTKSESDLILDLLRKKGIADPTKIMYEDDDSNVVEVNFYELEKEEQLALLEATDPDANGLSEHENEVLGYLRSNNVTFDEVIDHFSRQAIEDYIRNSYSQGLSIDGFDDEELFKLDLKSQYEDLTDEEIELQFQKELEHKELFDKKVKRIRQEYIEAEAAQLEAVEQERLQEEQERFEKLTNELVEAAGSIEDIGGLTLEDNDRNEVLDFVLNRDINGVSNFIKSLDNKETLFKLAWFSLKGQEAFDALHDYYKKEIEKARRTSLFKQPKGEEKKDIKNKSVVVRRPTNNRPNFSNTSKNTFESNISIDDLTP